MRVTEREICGSFRRAENQKQQIQILTELTCKSKYQIIGILLRNGEKVPKSIENQLYKRLDALDAQIFECEMEYKEIVTALTGENRRKEHGNRIQRHGRTKQEQQGRGAKDGQQSADFISCVAFGRDGEFAEKYLKQGTKVVVTGRIQTGSYTNRDGQKVYTTDVIVEEQEFAESKKAAGQQDGNNGGYSDAGDGFMNIPDGIDEELPFN